MIILASIFRLVDGLPLTATTDVDHNRSAVKDCQKYVKLISKRLKQLPDKCTLSLDGFKIHAISALDLSFLVLCEDQYPTVLAFCFLNEIQKEFLLDVDRQNVQRVKRPYAFIQYDSFLQKTKQRYNNPRSLSTRVNITDMSEELRLRPAYQVQESDILPDSPMVYSNGASKHSPVTAEMRLEPLTWLGMLSIALNLFCALLHLTRGMAIISHGDFDERDTGAYRYGAAFLLSACLCLFQIGEILKGARHRTWLPWITLASQLFCHFVVANLRNWPQNLFHVSANVLAIYVVLSRTLIQKGPHYSV